MSDFFSGLFLYPGVFCPCLVSLRACVPVCIADRQDKGCITGVKKDARTQFQQRLKVCITFCKYVSGLCIRERITY